VTNATAPAIVIAAALAVATWLGSGSADASAISRGGIRNLGRCDLGETDGEVKRDRLGNVVIDGRAEFVLIYRPGEFVDLGAIAAATGVRCAASYMNASDNGQSAAERTVICMEYRLRQDQWVEPTPPTPEPDEPH